jgi:hypothetical protein
VSVSDVITSEFSLLTRRNFPVSPCLTNECDGWDRDKQKLDKYLHSAKDYIRKYAWKYYMCELLAFFVLVSSTHSAVAGFVVTESSARRSST